MCTRERCPFCEAQLGACECIHFVLELTEEESRVVGEYVDDHVEPLKSIVARWREAVEAEGRIPF
jgi:hypothetical protein